MHGGTSGFVDGVFYLETAQFQRVVLSSHSFE
jgi:hypothetical protein